MRGFYVFIRGKKFVDKGKERERAFISSHRVGRLATVDEEGKPHVIPICYVYNGAYIYSPLDEKPKRVPIERLKRVRNIQSRPEVCLVIDRYSEEWNQLGYVLIQGTALLLQAGEEHEEALRLLREKYPQYRKMALEERPMIKITPKKILSWGAV
ncbi:MAG: TIGR03668 family PPOX class F420-dependent oxidoreductase [Dehalococcoidia bacterium]